MKKIDVSIGICAYNEEQNIEKLLNSLFMQKLDKFNIVEVLVFSDGSTDKTNEIVSSLSVRYEKIKLFTNEKRMGKYWAVNRFIKEAKSNVLVLESADTIADDNAVEILCTPLLADTVGAVCSRPIPINLGHGLLGEIVSFMWDLHHKISLKRPKFGEMIAFRNIIGSIPKTICDEEMIACLIQRNGLLLKYSPEARVFNKGPQSINDFLKQRSRIFLGHLYLRYDNKYRVSTLDGKILLSIICSEFEKYKFGIVFTAMCLELLARILGLMDFIFKRERFIWEMIPSTKRLE